MATLTVQDVGDGLADVTFAAAAAGGDAVPAGIENANHHLDGVFLLINNGGAGAINVTVANRALVAVGAGDIGMIPCNRGVYPGNLIGVTYSGVTTVTVAAVRI
jgi:hypothetical protein